MSVRPKKKLVRRGVRSNWWEWPTFFTRRAYFRNLDENPIIVELILPDGAKINLGRFPDTGNPDDLRRVVARHFRKIWDPSKCCQRPG